MCHVLDHFERADEIEVLQAKRGKFAMMISNCAGASEPHRLGMGSGDGDVLFRRIHTRHMRAKPGERFAQQSGTASRI